MFVSEDLKKYAKITLLCMKIMFMLEVKELGSLKLEHLRTYAGRPPG